MNHTVTFDGPCRHQHLRHALVDTSASVLTRSVPLDADASANASALANVDASTLTYSVPLNANASTLADINASASTPMLCSSRRHLLQ
ncbi:hypothetical protein NL676_038557 [Syzygium grande]|nr:hypothetical protein NL676_038557 [Syzygium grande]